MLFCRLVALFLQISAASWSSFCFWIPLLFGCIFKSRRCFWVKLWMHSGLLFFSVSTKVWFPGLFLNWCSTLKSSDPPLSVFGLCYFWCSGLVRLHQSCSCVRDAQFLCLSLLAPVDFAEVMPCCFLSAAACLLLSCCPPSVATLLVSPPCYSADFVLVLPDFLGCLVLFQSLRPSFASPSSYLFPVSIF